MFVNIEAEAMFYFQLPRVIVQSICGSSNRVAASCWLLVTPWSLEVCLGLFGDYDMEWCDLFLQCKGTSVLFIQACVCVEL